MALPSNWLSALRINLFLTLLVAVSVAYLTFPFEKVLKDLLVWINDDLGVEPFGPLVLAIASIPFTILGIPTSVLMLGGGCLFGLPIGFVAGSVGATIAATATFLLGRTIGKSYVISSLKYNPKLQAVALAIQRSGFKIVFLLRLAPLLQFSFLDYLLSVTPVNIGDYILASWFGKMPMAFALAYYGTTLKDLSDIDVTRRWKWNEVSTTSWVVMGIGFAVSVLLIICIMKVVKTSLDKVLAENADLQGSFVPFGLSLQSDAAQLDLPKPLIINIDSKADLLK